MVVVVGGHVGEGAGDAAAKEGIVPPGSGVPAGEGETAFSMVAVVAGLVGEGRGGMLWKSDDARAERRSSTGVPAGGSGLRWAGGGDGGGGGIGGGIGGGGGGSGGGGGGGGGDGDGGRSKDGLEAYSQRDGRASAGTRS